MKIISRDEYRILELFRDFLVQHKDLTHIDLFMNKFEFYCDALGKIDQEIGERFYKYWCDLEQIYAWYLSKERSEPNDFEKRKMLEIYDQILAYSEAILKKCISEPEDPYVWPFEEYK